MKIISMDSSSDKKRTPYFRRIIGITLFLFLIAGFIIYPASAQSVAAEVGFFEPLEAAPGSLFQVPVSIRNVTDLYGLDFILEFDPRVVQIVDADPADEGVQAAIGDFLDPGLLLYNDADNEAGTYRFAMSQVNPSEPKSGEGNVIIITFDVAGEGETTLEMSYLKLGSREGIEIPSTGVDGSIVVNDNAPAQSVTYQVVDATSIIAVQTFTPTPTATPVPTNTPLPTSTSTPKAETLEGSSNTGEANGGNSEVSYWLVKNWWILVGLLAVVVAMAAYLVKIDRKNTKEEEIKDEK